MSTTRARAGAATVAAIILASINLRTVLASVPPLVPDIRADLGISATVAGLVTTLPVFSMGAFALLAPRLARRFPIERLLAVMMAGTAAGTALRAVEETAALLVSALVIGVSIAVAQALVPVLVRARYSGQAGALTGTFSMALPLGATIASGSSVPLENALGGWGPSLAVWTLPALAAMVVWTLAPGRTTIDAPPRAALWRRPLAWSVALFMGIQSMAFYATLSWLPSILEEEGRSPEAAGALLALTAIVSLPTAFFAPLAGARMNSQTGLMLATILVPSVGVTGLLLAPGAAVLWIVLTGMGQGAALGLGMMLPLLRGGDANTAASLTAMTLTVGYIVAAFGPWILGAAHDLSGDWAVPLLALLAMTIGQLPVGLPAARARTIAKNGA